MKRGLVAAGIALAVLGVIVGFLPQSVKTVNCGSLFAADERSAYVSDLGSTLTGSYGVTDRVGECADKRQAMILPVVLLIGGGVVLTVTGFVVGSRQKPETLQQQTSEAPTA